MKGLLSEDEQRYQQVIAQRQEQQIGQVPQAQLTQEEEGYQSVIRERIDQQDEALRQSLMVSVGKDPDQMAQIQKLADQSGMPVELVQRNIASIVRDQRVNQLKESARFSPVLARQLSDPDFAALAYDDTERLSSLEYVLTRPVDWSRAALEGAIGTAAGRGISGAGALYGVGVRNLDAALERILPNSTMGFLRTPVPSFLSPEHVLRGVGGQLEGVGDIIGVPQERRTFDVEVAGAVGQLGAQIAFYLTNPVFGTALMLGQGASIMEEMVEDDDASQAAKDMAIVSGALITGITERMGIEFILNKLPPKIRNRTLRYIANAAMGGGVEAAQEVVENILHDLARRFYTDADAEMFEGLLDEASVAGVAGAIVRAALTKRSYNRAKLQEDFFRSLGEDAKASKLRERMPERFQDYVNSLTQNSPVKEIYIPSDRFNTYFQSQNVNPEAKAAEFGAVNYFEATAAGTDIVIPLNEFTAKLAPTDDLQGLFADLRLEPDGLTAREFEQYKADEEAKLDQIMEQARRAVGETQAPGYQLILDEMRNQLIATGYEQSTAQAYASAYARAISTMAERAGLDPKTLHDQYSLNVTRPLPDVLTRDRRSDSQIDPLLDRLRKGDLPDQREIYGKSLLDFLIEQGGLRPVGEMVDVDIGRGPFQRNLIQETGMDADTAAALAVEAGYLQGRDFDTITETDLFDAIENELAGTPQFSVAQADPALQELALQLENLAQALEQLGIDLQQITDNAEVRRLINQATQSPEIRDAIEPLFQARQPTLEEQLDQLTEEQLDELLIQEGVQPASLMDVETFWDRGDIIYGFHEMDERPARIKTKTTLNTYAPDQLLSLSRQAVQEFLQEQFVAQPFPAEQTVEFGEFVTGQPVTFDFAHNTESATAMFGMPEPGDRFQRDLEPSGRYMTRVADAAQVDTSGTMISGTITFNNPLVVDSTNWKQTLSDFYGATGSQLSQRLIAAGYDGVVTINPTTDTRPAFTSEILDLTTFDSSQALYQQERGFIQFGPERKFNIKLLETADLSTFLHETGHFYLEVLGDLAQGPAANPQLQDDFAAVLKFLGLNSREELTLTGKDPSSAAYKKAVAAHEKFARAHEAYLMEGKAPSVELRPVFQRFKNWLKGIYKDFMRLDVKLTNEVRDVFDRIYATDQEIEAAKAEMSVDPLLIDAAMAGMTDAEFAAYRTTVQQASESGREALLQKLMKEKQRERQAWWKQELANVKEEVAKEFDETRAYQAFKRLTETDVKLNKAELVERYGKEYVKRLPRGFQRVYTNREGMPLDFVAKDSGFATGDELIEAMIGLPNRREFINAESERRMLERHGDMMTDGSISDQAKIDLHNNFREKMLMTELRALRRKASEVRPFVQAERAQQRETRRQLREALKVPPAAAFKQAAQGIIGQTAVRDIQPQRFLAAERKNGKEAERALVNGDAAAAAELKQKELLNHYLYLEAVKAQENSDKIAQYMAKFERKQTRERIAKAGKIYLDQIDAILDGYEFRRIPNRRIDRRASLAAFVENMEKKARGEDDFSADPVYIPQSVLEDARQINYRQVSYDQLQAINEAVRNLDNVARLKNRLMKLAEQRELDDVVSQAFDQIRSNTEGGLSRTLESQSRPERYKRFAKGFMLIHTKFATMAQQMDGWQQNGFFWNLLIRPMNEAATFEAVERAKVSKQLADLYKPYRDTNMTTKQFIPSLGAAMTLEARLTVALNWGRPENRQRLIDGNGFTQQNINDIFATLDSRDWTFVKGVWNLLESYWPMIEDQYTKLYGVPPKKADIIGFNTKDGEIPGGYYPISYDPTKSARAMAQSETDVLEQMKSGGYVRSMTKNGYTKEALENVDRPIKLDFSGLYQHLNTVIHDLSLREYLIDVNKLMNHRYEGTTLRDVIIDSYGDQFYREIVTTIKDVTIGDVTAQNAFDQSLGHLRNGVAIVGMGWSLWTGLMQPLGITQSMIKIGPRWVAKGMAKWGGDIFKLQSTSKMIYEKSDFMRTRYLTQNREINDIRNRIKRQGKFPIAKETYGIVEDSYFQLIIQFQKLVDIPTWVGQYEKSLAFGQDEATAIALADQAVLDSQSGGALKDLSRIQRGSPLLKIWTVFYSYFNTTFNLMRISYGRTDFRDPVSIGRLAADVFLGLLAPAMITTALREAVQFVIGGEPSDEEELIDAYIREQLGYILGTVVGVREFASMVDPRFSYSGPAGVRIVAEAQRLAIQVSQGELDNALRRSATTVGGILLHYPAGQINRIIDGILALEEGRTDKLGALIFGAPR